MSAPSPKLAWCESDGPFAVEFETPGEMEVAGAALETQLASAIDLDLLRVDFDLTEDTTAERRTFRPQLSIAPAGKVGFTATAEEQFLEVRPKVPAADYLALMLLAEGHDALSWDHAAILNGVSGPDSLVELLIAGLVRSVGDLVRGVGLRRNHQRVQETLTARTRGRVLVGRYLTNLATGRLLDVPCSFDRHDIDNLPNRTLRWALRLSRAVLEQAGRETMFEELRDLESTFEAFGVAGKPVRREDLRGLERLSSGFDPYKPALSIARLLIRELRPTIADGAIKSISLAVDMAGTFETAFAVLCRARFPEKGATRTQAQWALELSRGTQSQGNGRLRPDVVIAAGDTVLVLDTKWKSVIDQAWQRTPPVSDRVRIQDALAVGDGVLPRSVSFNYGDLHQMWSYLHIASVLNPGKHVVGALVYPTSEGARPPIEVRAVGAASDGPRGLHLIGWDVHLDRFSDGVEALCTSLGDLLAGAATPR